MKKQKKKIILQLKGKKHTEKGNNNTEKGNNNTEKSI